MLTSAVAAKILNVHESSVKRWCNDGLIPFKVTPGGHRRVAFDDLKQFARKQNIEVSIFEFKDDALKVWELCASIKKRKIPEGLVTLFLSWLKRYDVGKPRRLLEYLIFERDCPLSLCFDELIYPTMYCVGHQWEKGELSVGIEHLVSQTIKRALSYVHDKLAEKEDWAQKIEDLDKRAIVGCSEANQHDIGANTVGIFLESCGFQIQYLGSSVPVYEYIQFQNRYQADLICISFSPLNKESQIQSQLEVLKHCYDDKKPYRLIIGGQTDYTHDQIANYKHPFMSLDYFQSISELETWFNEIKDRV